MDKTVLYKTVINMQTSLKNETSSLVHETRQKIEYYLQNYFTGKVPQSTIDKLLDLVYINIENNNISSLAYQNNKNLDKIADGIYEAINILLNNINENNLYLNVCENRFKDTLLKVKAQNYYLDDVFITTLYYQLRKYILNYHLATDNDMIEIKNKIRNVENEYKDNYQIILNEYLDKEFDNVMNIVKENGVSIVLESNLNKVNKALSLINLKVEKQGDCYYSVDENGNIISKVEDKGYLKITDDIKADLEPDYITIYNTKLNANYRVTPNNIRIREDDRSVSIKKENGIIIYEGIKTIVDDDLAIHQEKLTDAEIKEVLHKNIPGLNKEQNKKMSH